MPADQFLRSRQTESMPLDLAGHQRIENGILQGRRDARPVILDFYAGYDRVAIFAYREIHDGPAAQGNHAAALEGRSGILHEVQECLDHLVPVEVNFR